MKSQMRRIAAGILFVLLAIGLVACSGAGAPAAATQAVEDTLPPVESNVSIRAEGRVVPAQDANLSFQSSGVIAEVFVREGDAVQADQPLARLIGNEQLEAAVTAAELELLSAEQALDDLQTTAELSRAQVELEVAEATKELDKTEDRLESKEYKRGDQEQVDIARANYVIAEDGVTQAEEIYDRVDDRGDDDPVRAEGLSALAAARQRRDTALWNLNYLLGKPDAMDVAKINAEVAVARARLADAQARLERMKDGPDTKKLALAEARVKNANAALAAARASLDDLELRAPFAGTVSSINASAGEFATPGAAVVQVANFAEWNVETTDLTELNIASIALGQPAMIHFDALPDTGLIGRVVRIKPLGENSQGDIVYTVVLQLESADPRLHWNMTASIEFLEKDQ